MFDNIAQLEKAVQEFHSNILASTELLQCLDDLVKSMKVEREELSEKMTNLQKSVEQHTSDNTRRVSDSVDSLLKGHKKAADELTTEIHTALEELRQNNADDFARLQETISSATETNTANLQIVSQKSNECLEKFNASNMEHIYDYCVKLEHNVNQKFMFLGVGIAVTAILALLSIIL